MRYVNEHLAKRVFKFEGLSTIANMAKRETIASLMTSHLVIIMLRCILIRDVLWASNGWADIIKTIAAPSGYHLLLGYSQKSYVN
jgi:hypothetical protein